MKRIPLILSPALLLLLPAIALYPILHASAEKDGVDSSTAIQEAAPSEAAPSEAAPSEAAPLDSAVAAPAAPVAVSGSIDTDSPHRRPAGASPLYDRLLYHARGPDGAEHRRRILRRRHRRL